MCILYSGSSSDSAAVAHCTGSAGWADQLQGHHNDLVGSFFRSDKSRERSHWSAVVGRVRLPLPYFHICSLTCYMPVRFQWGVRVCRADSGRQIECGRSDLSKKYAKKKCDNYLYYLFGYSCPTSWQKYLSEWWYCLCL
jgi:hypothetical protein